LFLGVAALENPIHAQQPTGDADPWSSSDLIQPEQLVKELQNKSGPRVFYVGFPVLYRSAHIPGAKLAGPCSQKAGLDTLRAELTKLQKEQEFVLYCGCCPWDHCPNVRPAYRLVREMGFKRAKLLVIPTNLHTDWTSKGYPVERAVDTSAKP
jgi:thiosulfate/3-mercaptopyruvate sulfurtransferase